MRKTQPIGMKRLALHSRSTSPSIKTVRNQRVPDGCHVHPNLMGAPSVQGALHPATEVIACKPSHIRARSLSGMTVQVDYSHAQTVAWIAPDRSVHGAIHRSAPMPPSNSHILAMDLTLTDHLNQGIHSRARAGNNHQAAGVLVESMHDARSGYLGRMSIPAQQTVEQRATPVAGCRVHYQACRFVDHEQMGVFVRHVERHDLGSKSLAFLRGTHLQLNAVAHLYALCRLEHRLPIQTRGTCSQLAT